MNQLSNPYVEHALISEKQGSLRQTGSQQVSNHLAGPGPIRRSLGLALIRIGETLRGRSAALATITDDDREIALRLAA